MQIDCIVGFYLCIEIQKEHYMKVYQALKEKKKLISSITQLTELIKENNSIQAENEFEFELSDLLDKRKKKVEELIDLKVRLAKTALKIQTSIFKLSELKLELQMLRNIDTKQGVSYDYSENLITKKVQLTKIEVLKMIEAVIEKIDATQSKIDEFNYSQELL